MAQCRYILPHSKELLHRNRCSCSSTCNIVCLCNDLIHRLELPKRRNKGSSNEGGVHWENGDLVYETRFNSRIPEKTVNWYMWIIIKGPCNIFARVGYLTAVSRKRNQLSPPIEHVLYQICLQLSGSKLFIYGWVMFQHRIKNVRFYFPLLY